MIEPPRRGRRRQPLLGSHQRCWIWGRHVVLETLRAGRWPVLELMLADRLSAMEIAAARGLAEPRGYPVVVAGAAELEKRCRSREHQGYAAKMPPFPCDDPAAILANRPARPLYVVLDRVQDPFNFGAILRCADAFGVDGVFVEAGGQARVSSQVARSSAGAVNHLRIAEVSDLPALTSRLRELGIAVVAADEQAERELFDCDFRSATAIVIGNEGSGIRPELSASCRDRVRIPQGGHVGSLNAAVSAGIVLYEAARQRGSANPRVATRGLGDI